MSTVGPVCHIPPNTTAETHEPVNLPAIPPAMPNLQSLTATVNALRQALMIYTGQRGPQGAQGRSGKDAPSGSWTQSDIQTEKVKIYQNNDPSTGNFVEIERVNKLTMKNNSTNQTWVFNRPRDT